MVSFVLSSSFAPKAWMKLLNKVWIFLYSSFFQVMEVFLIEFLHLCMDTTYKSKSKAQILYELLELQSLRSKSDRLTR